MIPQSFAQLMKFALAIEQGKAIQIKTWQIIEPDGRFVNLCNLVSPMELTVTILELVFILKTKIF